MSGDWSRRYVGIPWRDHGRDFNGCDCWGLVRLVLKGERCVELPSYAEVYASVAERAEIDAALRSGATAPDWTAVAAGAERPFDVLVFRRGQWGAHVGVVVGAGLMLHTADGAASRLERWRSPAWAHRLVGCWRRTDV